MIILYIIYNYLTKTKGTSEFIKKNFGVGYHLQIRCKENTLREFESKR